MVTDGVTDTVDLTEAIDGERFVEATGLDFPDFPDSPIDVAGEDRLVLGEIE